MLNACVQKFDVTDTVQFFLGTKRSLRVFYSRIFLGLATVALSFLFDN